MRPRSASSCNESIGSSIQDVRPGSDEALAVLGVLRENGLWSQYLQVGLGIHPEVFTKGPLLSSVGHGSDVGIAGISAWNNPEPELALVIDRDGTPKGATLGNDANLRDIEGSSALLLPLAKDNNAAAALGPFVRLFDDGFTLADAAATTITMRIEGTDGFVLEATAPQSEISRPMTELIDHTVGRRHQYPDGLVLLLRDAVRPDRGPRRARHGLHPPRRRPRLDQRARARHARQPRDRERAGAGRGTTGSGTCSATLAAETGPEAAEPVIAVTDTAVGDDDLERALAEETGAEYRRADADSELGAALDDAAVVFTNFVAARARASSGDSPRRRRDPVRRRGGQRRPRRGGGAGVRVCNVPDYGANVVADHAVMLAAMLVRRVRDFDAALHRGEEPDADAFGAIPSLESRTVGLVGAGRIAQLTASRFHAFGCRTLAFDPFADAGELAEHDIELVPWERLLAEQRPDLAARAAHRRHPPPARRRRVRRDAPRRPRHQHRPRRARRLRRARCGRWTRASSPARRSTSPIPSRCPKDAPLRARPEVILTPHVAFYSVESMARLQRLAVDEAPARPRRRAAAMPRAAAGTPVSDQEGPV